VLVAISVPAATTVQAATGANYTGRKTDGTTTVYPLTGTQGTISTFPYLLQIEYSTTTNRVVVIGDSISIGYNAYWDVPGLGRSPYIGLGIDHGLAVFNYGISAIRLYNYFDDVQSEMSASQPQSMQDVAAVVRGAIVIVQAGLNDLPYASVQGGTTAYTSYGVMTYKAVHLLRSLGAKAIVYQTRA
jgi:hypothetical protein